MPTGGEIDTTKPFRSMVRLAELVQYVLDTSADNETDWIEWKSGIDLSKPAGRFAAAKQIIGFANRDPGRAAVYGGGCGFLVLGAGPGNLAGQDSMDPSQVEAAVRSYVGTDGPAWMPQTVNVRGTNVVVITVEPPQWGDPIYALRKDFLPADGTGARDGDVFVRRVGGTHRATSDELRTLQLRLLNKPADGIAVVVQSVGQPIPRVGLADAALDAWLAAERERLLRPMEADERERLAKEAASTRPLTAKELRLHAPAINAMAQLQQSAAQLARMSSLVGGGPTHLPEDRSPDEYREAVNAYIAEARDSVLEFAVDQFDSVGAAALELRVVNTGDRNLESVELVVHFPGAVRTHDYCNAAMPAPPRIWGPRPNPDNYMLGLSARMNFPQVTIPSINSPGYTAKNTGSTTIEYAAFDLRPHKEYDLPPVSLIVEAELTVAITGSWTATATNRNGRAEGSVTVPLADAVISIEDLLAETE